jgi:hypothetical protein
LKSQGDKMKITNLVITCLFLFFAQIAAAEWLGCDIPDPAENVTGYAVTVDSQAEVVVPYQVNSAGDAVLLWDITNITNAGFAVYSINSQGRRSAVPTPFDLLAAPSGPSGVKIVLP